MESRKFTREDALRVIAAKNAQKKVSVQITQQQLKLKAYVMIRPSPLKNEVKEEQDDDDNW